MNKPRIETTNYNAENAAKHMELLPVVVADSKVNIDRLRAHVGVEMI